MLKRYAIHLNDYAIRVEVDRDDMPSAIEIEGPDEQVSQQIGERFKMLLMSESGQALLSAAALTEFPKVQEAAEAEVSAILGVPPRGESSISTAAPPS